MFYNCLGIAYRRQQKFDMAINLFNKAFHFHPRDEHLLYNVARCYCGDGGVAAGYCS